MEAWSHAALNCVEQVPFGSGIIGEWHFCAFTSCRMRRSTVSHASTAARLRSNCAHRRLKEKRCGSNPFSRQAIETVSACHRAETGLRIARQTDSDRWLNLGRCAHENAQQRMRNSQMRGCFEATDVFARVANS